jgi:hypothetical protein
VANVDERLRALAKEPLSRSKDSSDTTSSKAETKGTTR